MGYSGRYHAASLAAVFVALAIGILIGVGLADDVVSGASQELEDSLRSDLDAANGEAEDLAAKLAQERQFSDRAAPALVAGRLARQRVALIALGELPEDTADDAQAAIEAAGAELGSVAVIAAPLDVAALRAEAGGRFAASRRPPSRVEAFGAAVGRQLAGGGPLIERLRDKLFVRFNGDLSGVRRIVLVAQPPEELQGDLSGEGRAFTSGLLRGLDARAAGAVGVERTSTDPTTLGTFSDAGIATVDDVETGPGAVAVVYALLGAEGDFGVKDAATSLLPDLLASQPSPSAKRSQPAR